MAKMNYLGHLKTITKHHNLVMGYCMRAGLVWQGLTHDLSKLSPEEFLVGARYYQGTRSPNNAEREDIGYSTAWLHHKGRNRHHWEYWCDYNNDTGEVFPHKIPYRFVVEMICDWIGAGMVYSGEKWTEEEPLAYYEKVRAGRHFHPETEELILRFLNCIKFSGLETFHRMARGEHEFNYIAREYDGTELPRGY